VKVIHVCNVALPPDHPDGRRLSFHPGRWVLNLALAQQRHTGIAPELLVQTPGASANYQTMMDGIPVHFMAAPDRLRSSTLFWFDKRRLARKLRELRPDFVHAHGTEDAYGLAAQESGLPYVITAQGLIFLINRVLKPRLCSRDRAVEIAERLCLRRARDVIAKSEYVAAELKAQFSHLYLHQIPNTFDARLLDISPVPRGDIVAFVGTVTPRKGVHVLRAALALAMEKVPDIQLWIFGDDSAQPSEYEVSEKTRLRELMGDRLVLHGILPSLEVAQRLAQAAALAAPSQEEMFGNQLIESLLVGTHGIVTDGTAMAENVRRFGNGTVVPQEDAPALAAAIVAAIRVRDFPERDAARQRVIAAMGPEVVARQHEALYRTVLEPR
jgi:glycosyltransferase involved in cell wall biosynthesis